MSDLECFKDTIFDLLNEADNLAIKDVETNDKENIFQVFLKNGNIFELECRQIAQTKEAIKNQIFILEEEKENCKKVADAFSELYECSDIIVVDVGKYGFAKFQYYSIQEGFEKVETYINSQSLFYDLWEEWFNIQLMNLSRGTPLEDMDFKDIFKCMPNKKQEEILQKQLYFAEKAGIETIIAKTKKELKIE